MTLGRTNESINKAEDAGRLDLQTGLADGLRRIFPTGLASYLQFRGWIHQETLCNRSSVTFDLRQCEDQGELNRLRRPALRRPPSDKNLYGHRAALALVDPHDFANRRFGSVDPVHSL